MERSVISHGRHIPPVKIYLIGSLRNQRVPELANELRKHFPNATIFDDWFSAGPEADDYWQKYEKMKGLSLKDALKGEAARNVFTFDKRHLDSSDVCILLTPAGKSGHLELGYFLGCGKPGFVHFTEDPDRWDVMYQFATAVTTGFGDLVSEVDKVIGSSKA